MHHHHHHFFVQYNEYMKQFIKTTHQYSETLTYISIDSAVFDAPVRNTVSIKCNQKLYGVAHKK